VEAFVKVCVLPILGALAVSACSASTPECGDEACAEICAKAVADAAVPDPGSLSVSPFEKDLLDPILEAVRQGVQPVNDEAIGICRGRQTCEEYLGLEVGELPPGVYMIRAELRVPDVGERGTWNVDFSTECVSIREGAKADQQTRHPYERSYDVVHSPAKDRGFRLQPMQTIQSPSKYGARECTWKFVIPRASGEDEVFSGSWSVPGAAADE
jgi:hypothetical protein